MIELRSLSADLHKILAIKFNSLWILKDYVGLFINQIIAIDNVFLHLNTLLDIFTI